MMTWTHVLRFTWRRTALLSTLLLACAGQLTSCGGGGGGSATGAISGTMSVIGTGGSVLEAEPNNQLGQAHALGDLNPGTSLSVLGNLSNTSDSIDIFRVNAPSRSTVQFTLTALNPSAPVNFDLGLADSVSLQFIELFDSVTPNVESGSFLAQGSFILVLGALAGESDYQLSLTVTAAPSPIPEVEPNNDSGQAHFLGGLALGEGLVVSGTAGPTDTSDRFLLAVPQAGQFFFSLDTLNDEDFDVVISNATADLFNPVFMQGFISANDPEEGNLPVPAMTLLEIWVFPFSGPDSYTLTMGLAPSPLGPDSDPSGFAQASAVRLSLARRGNPVAQAARLRNPGLARFFQAPVTEFVTGEVLVAGPALGALSACIASRAGTVAAAIPNGAQRVCFDLPDHLSPTEQRRYTLALAATMDADPAVRFAEPNHIQHAASFDTTPNDTHYNLQWHYNLINLPAAWDITTGNSSVIVAVIDTGTTPAQDLTPRTIAGYDMISNPARSGDGDGPDPDATDVGDSTTQTNNSSFHGSHVAGTVGASTNDGFGVAGVTWATQLMPVRVLGIGGGTAFDIANGILFAAGLANSTGALPAQAAHIMNMSLGGLGFIQVEQDAVTAARNAGTLVIAAAGNDNNNAFNSPAGLDGVISVSAVDTQGNKAPYSSFHPTVDIAAPGGNVNVDLTGDNYADGVLSCRPVDTSNPTDFDSYSFYDGTSMAAPHVAGVAALLLAVDPTLTVPQLENFLLTTSTDRGAPGRDDIYGEGLINAFAAVQFANGGGGVTPVLGLSSTSVLLNNNNTAISVAVSNVGASLLELTALNISTQTGGSWLSANSVPIQNPTSSDSSSIEIQANITGLLDGVYSGAVEVVSNGGTRTIAVSLALSSAGGGGETHEVFVLAISTDTLTTIAQEVVQSPNALGYAFSGLAPGSYFVVAGTDADNDGFICDEGEPLCGIYPSAEGPIALTVTAGGNLTAVDFPLLSTFTGSAASASGRTGYQLLQATESPASQIP